MLYVVPFCDGDGRQMNLGKGFHNLFHIPTVRGLLSQMEGLLLRNQGQETQHPPPHDSVLDFLPNNLNGLILLIEIAERDDSDEGIPKYILTLP